MEVDSRRIALSCTHDAIRACLLRRREELEVVTRRERGRRKRRRRVEFIGIGIGIEFLASKNREKGKRTVYGSVGKEPTWAKMVRQESWCEGSLHGVWMQSCVDLISFVGD